MDALGYQGRIYQCDHLRDDDSGMAICITIILIICSGICKIVSATTIVATLGVVMSIAIGVVNSNGTRTTTSRDTRIDAHNNPRANGCVASPCRATTRGKEKR